MRLTKVEVLRETIKIVVSALSEKSVPVTQAGARAFVEWHPVTGAPKRINIPYVPDNASDRLIKAVQGFVDHECAHVLFTDFNCVKAALKSGAGMVGNILEDTYIEREMKKLYAGSRHNLLEVWGFIAEEMLQKPLDAAIEEGSRPKIVATGLPIAIHAWAGNEAAEEFMATRWEAFKDIEKIIGLDIIEEIPNVKSSKEGLLLAVAIKNRLMDWKEKEEREERERRKKEKEECEGEPESDSPGDPSMDDVLDPPTDPDGDGDPDPDAPFDEDEDDADSHGDDDCEEGDESDDDYDEDDDDFRPPDPRSDDDDDDGDEAESESEDDDDEADEGEDEEESEGEGGEADEDEEESTEGKDGEEDSDGEDSSAEDGEETKEEKEERGSTSPEGPPEPEEESEEEEEDISDFESEAEEILEAMDDMEDMESLANELIAEEMDEALKTVDYWPLTKDADIIERYTPEHTNADYVRKRQEDIAKHIGQLTKHLQRMIQARSYDRKIPGFRTGKLDGSALHRVPTGDDRVFRRVHRMTTKDVDVQLVVDLSGSMHGQKVELATEVAYAVGLPLDRLGINNQIIGFTTADMNLVTHHLEIVERDAEKDSGCRRPSRYEPIYMPILKDWSQNFTADRQSAVIMAAKDVRLRNNLDGESVEYAGRMLWAQPGARKLMIVLSDGCPSAHGNYKEQAVHLRRVVKRLEAIGTEVFGIGIMDESVKRFYKNAVVINRMEEVLTTVMGVLEAMLMRGAL